ncbi:hypothetical protein GCM10008955_31130 [Deinococcus malanensis]|uniref:Uncharacterized protein n=1 Tax=Deinococcus malanensis TaxID=1706855 RepID=A0ABQ2EZQ4_9DEIO|nr:hypothetical protein GCM10008955_31130 [Deinococcus malanensis]
MKQGMTLLEKARHFFHTLFKGREQQGGPGMRTNSVFFQPRADHTGGIPGPFFERKDRLPPEVEQKPLDFGNHTESTRR